MKAEPRQPGQIKQPPTTTKGPVSVVIIQKRGGTGPDANLNPVPRKTHNQPQPKVEVVCE